MIVILGFLSTKVDIGEGVMLISVRAYGYSINHVSLFVKLLVKNGKVKRPLALPPKLLNVRA